MPDLATNPGAGNSGRPAADPFGERRVPRHRSVHRALGGRFEFETDVPALLALAADACGGLPVRAGRRAEPRFRVRLELAAGTATRGAAPPAQYFAAAGIVGVTLDAANLALVNPARREALVRVDATQLASRYLARCELLEFAVYTLATRARHLAPLHAACLGLGTRGLLLAGDSGAGKSMLTLLGACSGLGVLAEDSTLVEPRTLRATGLARYVHVRADTARFVEDAELRRRIVRSPVITRRSGVRKHEVDLPAAGLPPAPAPLDLRAIVFLSSRAAGRRLLRPLSPDAAMARLAREQPYAAGQETWPELQRRLRRLPSYELRRSTDPYAGVAALRGLLEG